MSEVMIATNAAPLMPALSIQQSIERYELLTEFVKTLLKPEIDYGAIPGTTKPTLLKPGAEKLLTFFGLTKRFAILERVEDWTGADHGEPFFYYLYRCALYYGDQLIAESDGSCNSYESKYRYRKADRVCPFCGKASIIKGREEYGGGWVCFKKKDGCGAKFGDADPDIVSQQVGRVINPDIADLVNTLQKMAQKRALIAATLLAVNASEFFIQDMEDLVENGESAPAETRTGSGRIDPRPKTLGDLVTPKQLWMIRNLGREIGCDVEHECRELFDVDDMEGINKKAASALIEHLKKLGGAGGNQEPGPETKKRKAPRGEAGQIMALAEGLGWDEERLAGEIRERLGFALTAETLLEGIAAMPAADQRTLIQALKLEFEARKPNTNKKGASR